MPKPNVPLIELLNRYRDESMRGGKSPKTVRLYRYAIEAARSYLGHAPSVADLTDSTLAGTMGRVVARGGAPRTANAHRDRLCALWRFARRCGLCATEPNVPPLREPERVPVGLTLDELRRLHSACGEQEGRVEGVPACVWWVALLLVAYDTGERVGAILRIEWGDVDLAGGWVRIPAEIRKGQTRDVLRRLHVETVRHLALLRGLSPDARVLPWPGNSTTMYYHWSRILRAAGLPVDRRHKFHCLRKTVASHFAAAGEDASRLLDHADRATTAKYLDPRIVGQVAPCDVLPRPWEAAR
jgi:integrase